MRVFDISERLACRLVGLTRSAFRRPLKGDTPEDPDRALRAWLRTCERKLRVGKSIQAWAGWVVISQVAGPPVAFLTEAVLHLAGGPALRSDPLPERSLIELHREDVMRTAAVKVSGVFSLRVQGVGGDHDSRHIRDLIKQRRKTGGLVRFYTDGFLPDHGPRRMVHGCEQEHPFPAPVLGPRISFPSTVITCRP